MTLPARPQPADFTAHAVSLAAVWLALLLVTGWLGLAAGVSVSRWHLWLNLAAFCVIAVVAAARGSNRSAGIGAALAVLIVFGLSLLLAARVFDTSYDGTAYHQVGVLALRDGWNPFTVPHVVDWSNAAWPGRQWQADKLADRGLWTDHFPKASWLLGAIVAAATGSIDAAKWLKGFLAAAATAALFRGLCAAGIARRLALPAAVVAVLSPVVVAQTNTNYVDGVLGCALLVQAGASMAWLVERRRGDLFAAVVALLLAANLKFTGLVYALLLMAMVLAAAWLMRWRPGRRELALWFGGGAAALLLVSAQTYGHNALAHGHPFYPVNDPQVMRGQMDDDFLARGRLGKFLVASTQVPAAEKHAAGMRWTLPRLWHYRTVALGYDVQLAGFGSLFIGSLALALVVSAAASLSLARLRRLDRGAATLLLLTAWAVASSLVNPELWWARYVPQLWWLPLLAAALAWRAGWRWLAGLTAAPAALATALVCLFWWQDMATVRPATERELAARARSGEIAVTNSRGNEPMLFTFARHAEARSARLVVRPLAECTPHRLGVIELCDPPR